MRDLCTHLIVPPAVVYECATAHPRLLRIQDPFGKLIVRAKGSVVIAEQQLFEAAAQDEGT